MNYVLGFARTICMWKKYLPAKKNQINGVVLIGAQIIAFLSLLVWLEIGSKLREHGKAKPGLPVEALNAQAKCLVRRDCKGSEKMYLTEKKKKSLLYKYPSYTLGNL